MTNRTSQSASLLKLLSENANRAISTVIAPRGVLLLPSSSLASAPSSLPPASGSATLPLCSSSVHNHHSASSTISVVGTCNANPTDATDLPAVAAIRPLFSEVLRNRDVISKFIAERGERHADGQHQQPQAGTHTTSSSNRERPCFVDTDSIRVSPILRLNIDFGDADMPACSAELLVKCAALLIHHAHTYLPEALLAAGFSCELKRLVAGGPWELILRFLPAAWYSTHVSRLRLDLAREYLCKAPAPSAYSPVPPGPSIVRKYVSTSISCDRLESRSDGSLATCLWKVKTRLIVNLPGTDPRFIVHCRVQNTREVLIAPCYHGGYRWPFAEKHHCNRDIVLETCFWATVMDVWVKIHERAGLRRCDQIDRVVLNFSKWATATSDNPDITEPHAHAHLIISHRLQRQLVGSGVKALIHKTQPFPDYSHRDDADLRSMVGEPSC